MRLIDADALQYSDARDMLPTGQYITREEIDKAAEPRTPAHWIEIYKTDKGKIVCCSACRCPNCGAKMEPPERTTKRTKEPPKEPKEQLKEPTRPGHWKPFTTEQGRTLGVYCSECRKWLLMNPTPYCPNCGAKMDEEEQT